MRSGGDLAFALRVRALRHRRGTAADRVGRLRRFARQQSPFYARHHAGLDPAPLEELPPVTKDDLMAAFDDVVTDRGLRRADLDHHLREAEPGTPLRGHRVAVTSGSSGPPAVFAYGASEWAAFVANAVESRAVGDPPGTGPLRSANVGSPSGWHLSGQVGRRGPGLRLSAATPTAELGRELEAFAPERLTAYPSVLTALATDALSGRLTIAPVQVRSAAEPLTTATRDLVREAWGVEVTDQYAVGEAGFLAVECPAHDGLHVLDRHVVLEVVDAEDRPVSPGTEGERLLLTVPSSRVVPLLRYVVEDRVTVLPGTCPCGRTTTRLRVAGRAREVLSFSGPEGPVPVHPVVFTRALDPLRIGAWRVTRRSDGLTVSVAGLGADVDADTVAGAVRASLAEVLADPPPVAVEVVPALDRAPGGKAARIVDDLPGEP